MFKESSGGTETLYFCTWENCIKKFKQLQGLEYHIRIHKKEKPFQCSSCVKTFRAKSQFIQHWKLKHVSNKTKESSISYSCTWENCNKKFKQLKGLKYHIRVHKRKKTLQFKEGIPIHTGENLFKCSVCNKCFRSKESLKTHLKVVHDPQGTTIESSTVKDTSYVCTWENCIKKFKQPQGLKYHIRMHKKEKQFQCSLCDKSLRSRSQFIHHWKLKHGSHNPSDQERCAKENTEEPLYLCTWENCNKKFRDFHTLTYHMSVHTGGNLFKCSVCNKCFRSKGILKRHLTVIHDPQKTTTFRFKCEICNFVFQAKERYINHLNSHSHEKFECDLCNSVFTTKNGCSNHLKNHSKTPQHKYIISRINYKNQYICDWENCKKIYKTRKGVKYHLTTHSNFKPFNCVSCHKCFRSKALLKQHERVSHDPERTMYECQHCNALFKTERGFRNHLQAHENNITTVPPKIYLDSDKTFKCDKCNKKFLKSKTLSWHKKQHGGVLVECAECHSKFTQKPSLIRHFRLVHKRTIPVGVQSTDSVRITKSSRKIINIKSTSSKNDTNTSEIISESTVRNLEHDSLDKTKNEYKSIKDEQFDIVETAVTELVKFEEDEPDVEATPSSSVPYHSTFIESICKEELILHD